MHSASKKTMAMLVPHDTVPSLTRVFVGKMELTGAMRNYSPMDLCGRELVGLRKKLEKC